MAKEKNFAGELTAEDVEKVVENELNDMTNTKPENVYKLRKPVTYNGAEISEVAFDFEKLTGADALNIEDELLQRATPPVSGAINSAAYLIRMASRACTAPVGEDFFQMISIVDFEKIKNRARFFLMGISR